MDKIEKQQVRTGGSLSWGEREAMIKEYLTGNYTKVKLWEKYTGQKEEHGQLLNWMRSLGYISNENPIGRKKQRPQPQETLDTENSDQDPIELQRRIKELEKELEASQLKAEGYELMIEIAEKELKTPIRKKSVTK